MSTIYILGVIIFLVIACVSYLEHEEDINQKYVVDAQFFCIGLTAIFLWPLTLVYLLSDFGIEKYLDWRDKK